MGRTPCCLKMGLNKGPWTPDEDLRLTSYIQSHGEGGWRTLPKKAGLLRCGKSCRLRWMNYLRPDVKRGHISPEEEDLILRLHRLLGNRWSLIAGRMPGRTDNEIKNYWNTHLSKKLISQGIDPRTHKPLSESHDTIICESAGDSDISQKSNQQDVIHGQRDGAKDENLPEGTSQFGYLSAGTAAPADAREDHSWIVKKANENPAGTSAVCNPQPASAIDIYQGDMSRKPPHASVNLQSANHGNPMEAVHYTNVLPSVLVECDSEGGSKQASLGLNNLPFTMDSDTSGIGGIGQQYYAPSLVNNTFDMASAIRGSSSQRDTPFYGLYDLTSDDRTSPLLISANADGENNRVSPNISLDMPDGLHNYSDMGHISASATGEAARMSTNPNAPVQGISAACSTYTYPITTPVAHTATYGDHSSDMFSSLLESFVNEEFILPEPAAHFGSHSMELSPEPQATNSNYDLWSILLSPTSQDHPSD